MDALPGVAGEAAGWMNYHIEFSKHGALQVNRTSGTKRSVRRICIDWGVGAGVVVRDQSSGHGTAPEERLAM